MLRCRGRGSHRSGSDPDRNRRMFRRRDLGGSHEFHCLWVGKCGLICSRGRHGRRFERGVLEVAFGRGESLPYRFYGRGEVRLGVLPLVG